MRKKYKIQLPKGKKVTMTNVDFENGVMTVNVELKKDDSKIWDKMIKEYGEAICGKTAQKYEPKDGDFVYVKARHEHIAIFKKEVAGYMYVYANWNMSFSVSKIIIDDSRPLCCIHDLREIRPATEEEKKLLIDKLAEAGKLWNEEKKCLDDVRWRAKVGETFYYIDTELFINSMIRFEFHYLWKKYNSLEERLKDERFNNIEYMLWKKGNYFKTREAAEKVAEQIREIFQNSKSE